MRKLESSFSAFPEPSHFAKKFFFSKMTRLLSPVIFQKYYYSRDMPSNLENSFFDLVFKRQFESILISKIDLFFDDCKSEF